MPAPLAIAGAGAAVNLFGRLLGGDKQPPSWLIDLLRGELDSNKLSDLMPDRGIFEAETQSRIDEILAGLPVSAEAFDAEAASRGVFGSGEGIREKYRSVYAPVARAATGAAVTGQVGYENLRVRAAAQDRALRLQVLQLLAGIMNPEESTGSKIGGFFEDIGAFGAGYGLNKELYG